MDKIPLDAARILRYAHAAKPSYEQALQAAGAQQVLDRHDISGTPLRMAHFLAQILYESVALSELEENLNYSAARLVAVWPTRFQPRGPLDPQAFAHQPQALADSVYMHRNGNTEPGDGYRFRGRGLLQLTGRSAYHAVTASLRQVDAAAPDLCEQPELVCDAAWAVAVAAAVWTSKGCNAYADRDRLDKVTCAINGGQTGINERRIWLGWMKRVYGAAASASPL